MNQRFGLRAVVRKPFRQHLRRIVGTNAFATLQHLSDALFDAREQRALVDTQFDHSVELELLLLQESVERFRLRHSAREAVENESVPRVVLLDPVGNDAHHHLVGDQPAACHDVFRDQTRRGLGGDSSAQHVSGGELNDTVVLNQSLCLCSLARPRRPEKDKSHLRRPLSFDLRIRPSYW